MPPNFDPEYIRELCEILGLTRDKLAKDAGVSRRTIERLLEGETQEIRAETYSLLLKAFQSRVVEHRKETRLGEREMPAPRSLKRPENTSTDVPLTINDVNSRLKALLNDRDTADGDSTLYVSVGDAGGLRTLLTGLPSHPDGEKYVLHVVARGLEPELSTVLEANGMLPEGYSKDLADNVRKCKKSLRELFGNAATLGPESWPSMPPFHGYLFREHLFWGKWTVNDVGQLTVENTPMFVATPDAESAGRYQMYRHMLISGEVATVDNELKH
jgi:transcriptional regulator with XRE-family HTH domain